MKKLLVSLYSNYLDAYDDPTLSQYPEEDLPTLYKRTIFADPDGAYKWRAHEKTLVIFGTFDDCKGKFELLENPKHVVPLASLFPPGYLQKKEANNA